MSRIFITGATGFIGRHLCRNLHEQGHDLIVLLRSPHKTSILPSSRIEFVKGSLQSFKDAEFKIPQADIVIHLAGTVTAQKQSDYKINNYDAVIDLYNCLSKQNWTPKRILFSSSLAATGPSDGKAPLTEQTPQNPIDAYGQAKLDAERFLVSQQNIPITIFRPCAVIGPLDTNILNLYKIAKSGFGFIPWGPPQSISFIAVHDLVNAIIKLTTDTSNKHRTYFVAHNDPLDSHRLWKEVGNSLNKNIKLIPVPRIVLKVIMLINTLVANTFKITNIFDKKYYQQINAIAWVCSSQALQDDFQWEASQSLPQVIEETTKSYNDAGWI